MSSLDEARAALRNRQGQGARYDAEGAPDQELANVRLGTAYFARKLNELSDAELYQSSAVPGLTRAAIVALVSYRARFFALLAEQARTGAPLSNEAAEFIPMDSGGLANEVDLASTLPPQALRNLFSHSEVHLNVEWRDLVSAQWDVMVRQSEGRWLTPRQAAALRSREIWLAAIDLGNGAGFSDLPPALLDHLLEDARRTCVPGRAELSPSDRTGQLPSTGRKNRPAIAGSSADLARWVTGRGPARVDHSFNAPIPRPYLHTETLMNRAERLFSLPDYPSIPVSGGGPEYPVHRIFCVGRNYAEHAREMGVEVDREAPFYFLKDASTVVATGSTIPYPPGTENFHYEMELVIAIGVPAFKIAEADAASAIFGFAAGLDMTRRDLQLAARAKQRPWDLGKNFEASSVLSPIVKADEIGEIGSQRIFLAVDGELKQDAKLSDLVWSPNELIAHLSQYYHLSPGDLIFTGTPAGVGPVVPGNIIHGEIDGLPPVDLTIGALE